MNTRMTLLCSAVVCLSMIALTVCADSRIQPYSENPRYWQYEGKPVVLLGGTDDDNLFQMTGLEAHLDLLVSVGGNYIRNTMSSRNDKGVEVPPFGQNSDGLFDLDQWNEEYWQRFEQMLKLTHERDIIVQVELWAIHDVSATSRWQASYWYPDRNVNYTFENTLLQAEYPDFMDDAHGLYETIPTLNNDRIVLSYQKRFIDKILEHTLKYDHVLYCISNEIHPPFSHEWGWFWAEYVQGKALEAGTRIEVSEMYWTPELRALKHRASLDHPEIYSYFEASQNTSNKIGREHWANLIWVWNYMREHPRPMNVVKIYGKDQIPRRLHQLDEDGRARMWRQVLAGCAASRFHRPTYGLGLSETSQNHLRSLRMWLAEYDIVNGEPDGSHRTLRERYYNEAYANHRGDEQWSVYFPDGGAVELVVPDEAHSYNVKWLDCESHTWVRASTMEANGRLALETPGEGQWLVLVTRM